MKRLTRLLISSILLASLIVPFQASTAHAITVTATGTDASVCNQNVDVTTGVVAYRLSGGDCVIEFKNTGTAMWTPNAGVISVRVLVVGGGGGGGGRHAGGGGAGGVVEVTNYPISGNVSVLVGSGGNGTSGGNAVKGSSGTNSRFYSSSEASAGSTGITALGGGYGDFYSIASNNIIRAGSGGSGGGSGVPNPFTRDLTAGYTNADPRGLTTQSAQAQKKFDGTTLSSGVTQYGHDGAGGGNDLYWAGGGGGGAGADGNRGGGAGGTSRVGGDGGAGVAISITGTSTYYGGGGGGGGGTDGTTTNYAAGAGGSGGGGAGSVGAGNATAGTANTGGGGGGGGLNTSGTNGNGGAGGSGVVIVRYTPDTTAPTFSNSATFSIPENSSISTNAATLSLSESSTIVVSSGADTSSFNLVISDSVTARIRFTSVPNYESPTDQGGDNSYNITMRATDLTGNYTDLAIVIQVSNVNEPPVISAFAGVDATTYSVTENTSALFNIGASNPDAGETITYTLTGTDSNDFIIGATGTLSFSPAPDFENPQDTNKDNVYVVITWASDGTLSDSQTVTITVTNLNEAPLLGAPSVSGSVYKGFATSLTVTVNTPGKVRFYMDGKRIANCLSVSTTGTNPNYVATCTWKPAITARHTITATFTPIDNTFSAASTSPATFWILKRTTTR